MSKANSFLEAGRTARPKRAKVGESHGSVKHPEGEKLTLHAARVPERLAMEIKKLAIDERTTAQALTAEALEMLLASRKVSK